MQVSQPVTTFIAAAVAIATKSTAKSAAVSLSAVGMGFSAVHVRVGVFGPAFVRLIAVLSLGVATERAEAGAVKATAVTVEAAAAAVEAATVEAVKAATVEAAI